jgi:predicted Rossmann fold flavoprotein
MTNFDVVIIGAGAAGLMCAGAAGQRGLRVLLLDHAAKVAEKIRISGGGRCNFTNLDVGPANFLSGNPHFCRSALACYTPGDFLAMLARHQVTWHEKHRGQLFCDGRSEDIIRVLLAECEAGQVERRQPCAVHAVRAIEARPDGARFEVDTDAGPVHARHVVVATGGLSIPKIGATDFGHRLAKQFGHAIVPLRPALVPLTFSEADWADFVPLAGASLGVQVSTPPPWAGRG